MKKPRYLEFKQRSMVMPDGSKQIAFDLRFNWGKAVAFRLIGPKLREQTKEGKKLAVDVLFKQLREDFDKAVKVGR